MPDLDGIKPSEADLEKDTKKEYCEASQDISLRMDREIRERSRFYAFVTLARAHCGGIALSEYGFPGYSRMQTILNRAIARTMVVVRLKGELCDRSKELVSSFFSSDYHIVACSW